MSRYDFHMLGQEQVAQAESMGQLRLTLDLLRRRVESLEDEVATLKAAHEAAVMHGGIDGLPGTVTVTVPPEWGGTIPLIEVE